MKRCILGAVVLLLLLTAGILTWAGFSRFQEPLLRELSLAETAARERQLEEARHHGRRAESLWQSARPFIAAACDHTPMEEIEGLFAQLAITRDPDGFAAVCTDLALRIHALEDAHVLNWQNLL